MKGFLWNRKLGFESLSRNLTPHAGFERQDGSARHAGTDTKPITSVGTAQKPCTAKGAPSALDHAIFATLAVTIVALIIGLLVCPRDADAKPRSWRSTTATWYGPSFYGNAFACSHRRDVPNRYGRNVRGAAHMTLPCGSRVTICRHRRCVRVRIIDRGAFHHGNFDLTARTAMDLCRCWQPYTMRVRWTRGWTTTTRSTT